MNGLKDLFARVVKEVRTAEEIIGDLVTRGGSELDTLSDVLKHLNHAIFLLYKFSCQHKDVFVDN